MMGKAGSMGKKSRGMIGTIAVMLMLAGLLTAMIQAVYTLPMPKLITIEGAAYYQGAMTILLVVMAATQLAIPHALGQQFRQRVVQGDTEGTVALFYRAWIALSVLGLVLAAVLYFSASPISNGMGLSSGVVTKTVENAELANNVKSSEVGFSSVLRTAAIFVVLSFSLSALRAYFNGLRSAMPTMLAGFVGQLVKLIFGLILAGRWAREDALQGAVGALAGVAIGEATTLLLLIVLYVMNFDHHELMRYRDRYDGSATDPNRDLAQGLLQSLFAFFGVMALPLCALIDAFQITPRLMEMGFSGLDAIEGYGIYAAVAAPIALFIPIFAYSLSESIAGNAYERTVRKRFSELRSMTASLSTIAIVLGIGMIGLCIVSGNQLLTQSYGSTLSLEAGKLETTQTILLLLVVGAAFSILGMMSAATLLGMQRSPAAVLVSIFTLLVKWISTAMLIGKDEINVLGAAFSTMLAAIVYAVLNAIFVWQYSGVRSRIAVQIIRPLLVGVLATLICWLLFDHVLVETLAERAALALWLRIGSFVLLYGGGCVLLRAIRNENWENIPFYSIPH